MATSNVRTTAHDILTAVGGKDNVADLMHCMTRLRFSLRDPAKADKARLERLPGVVSVIDSGGQVQVVMPDTVNAVHDELVGMVDVGHDGGATAGSGQGGFLGKAIDVISAIFTPIIPALAGAGVLKGLLILLDTMNLLDPASGAYQVLWGVADALFYFLPVMLAFTSARRFKADPFVAVTIAGALLLPALTTAIASEEGLSFFGLKLQPASYAYSVIPIIVAVWLLSLLQRWVNTWMPGPIRLFMTPLICFVIITPLTFLVFGPIGTTVAGAVGEGVMSLYNASPILAGVIMAGFWQVIVMFGLHWGSIPIMINNLTQFGYDVLLPFTGPAVFGQAGAAAAVAFKTRSQRMKSVAGAATTSAIFGITEPALYGVTLKLKKPFIAGSVGAAIGGGIAGAAGAQALAIVPASAASLPAFLGHGFVGYLIGNIVALLVGFVGTWLLGFRDDPETDAPVAPTFETRDEVLVAPVSGRIMALADVNDKAFAGGALGKGVAIKPSGHAIHAPAAGTIVSAAEMPHAVGLRTAKGAELLVHIGIDTVKLEGKGFTNHAASGAEVAAGDILVEFDSTAIAEAGYDDTVIVVVTNSGQYSDVVATTAETVHAGDTIITTVE